jgi:hypothetical protein
MIFGAVMYLFNVSSLNCKPLIDLHLPVRQAGKDVTENFNVLEDLFSKCSDALTQISQLVKGVRFLSIELQNDVIESLVAILDVFRISTKYAKEKRLGRCLYS